MMKYHHKLMTAFLLAAVLAAPPLLAGTYKWVDENGKVHYSDRPVEGAEEVKLPELPTYASPQPARPTPADAVGDEAGDSEEDLDEVAVDYSAFDFISPKPDQTFWNTGGTVPIQLNLQPGLQNGHQVRLFLNGQLRAGPSRSLGFTLNEMYRGTYTVRAVVEDASGQQLATVGPVKFYVKQTSIKN